MRRLRLAVGVGHGARLDGVEGVAALGIGADAAESLEGGIRQRPLVLRIGEAALRVGLPDLQHAVRHDRAVAVEHLSFDANAFARRSGVTRLLLNASFQSYLPFGVRP